MVVSEWVSGLGMWLGGTSLVSVVQFGSHFTKDERSASCNIWQAGVKLLDSSDLPAQPLS